MTRVTKRARSAASFGGPPRPTKSSVLIARPTPEVGSGGAGLEGLGQAFSNFFGQTTAAANTVAETLQRSELAKIEAENTQQQLTGVKKALNNEELTDDERADSDFTNSYHDALGGRDGAALAQGFQTWASENVGAFADVDAAKEQWLKEQTQNGLGFGTGNDLYDAKLLSTFEAQTSAFRLAHKQAGVKARLIKARQEKAADLAARLPEFEPPDVLGEIATARKMMPGSPDEAPGFVIDALIAGAGTDPEKLSHIHTLLNSPGSGDAERSFVEMFPEAGVEIEQKLVERYFNTKTLDGAKAYEDAAETIQATNDPAVLMAMLSSGGALDRVFEQHGGGASRFRLRTAARTKLVGAIKTTIKLNQIGGMLDGTAPLDAALVKKHLPDYLKREGLDWVENPEDVATIVTKLGHTSSANLKTEMSAALAHPTDVKRFSAALRFYRAVEAASGGNEKAATHLMDSYSVPDYLYAKRQAMFGVPLEDVATNLSENRADLAVIKQTGWGQLLDTERAEAEADVRSHITATLNDTFDRDVIVKPRAMADLMAYAKGIHMNRRAAGANDWKLNVKDAVTGASLRLQAYPVEDGKFAADTVRIPSVSPKLDEGGYPVLDESGKPVAEENLGFGPVVYPDGRVENTLDTWEVDSSELVKTLPILGDGSTLAGVGLSSGTNKLSVDGSSAFASKGVWLVKRSGRPILFEPGEEYSFNAVDEFGVTRPLATRLPEDPAEALALLQERFDFSASKKEAHSAFTESGQSADAQKRWDTVRTIDERLVLIPWPDDGSAGYILGYKPGRVLPPTPTFDELEKGYTKQKGN